MRISDWSSDVCSSVLAAERDARRPAEAGRPVRSIEARQWLRSAPVAAYVDLTPDSDEEFVLLVARRDPASGLAVIDTVPHKDRKSVVKGKSLSVPVDLGGRRLLTKKKTPTNPR